MQKQFLKECFKEVSEKLKRKQQQILERVPQIIDEYLEEEEAECNARRYGENSERPIKHEEKSEEDFSIENWEEDNCGVYHQFRHEK